jgi:hypothetical protein
MRAIVPTREKPRPLPEPLAAPAATNAENPAIDTMDESAAGSEAAVEAWQARRRDSREDRGEWTGMIVATDAER